MRIGVIGTCGRDKTKESYMTKELYLKMALTLLSKIKNYDNVTLVSGGAAWSDHLAVTLYLGGYVKNLELHLPCTFEDEFYDNGDRDWKTNPGYVSNMYHQKFSKKLGINSLLEIKTAIEKGAIVKVGKGFHDRNNGITNVDIMYAFTWGKDFPEEGGTKYTWDRTSSEKHHISLTNHHI